MEEMIQRLKVLERIEQQQTVVISLVGELQNPMVRMEEKLAHSESKIAEMEKEINELKTEIREMKEKRNGYIRNWELHYHKNFRRIESDLKLLSILSYCGIKHASVHPDHRRECQKFPDIPSELREKYPLESLYMRKHFSQHMQLLKEHFIENEVLLSIEDDRRFRSDDA